METLKNIYLFLTGRKSSKYMGFLSQRLLWISSSFFISGVVLIVCILAVDRLGANVTYKDYAIVGAMFFGVAASVVGFVVVPVALRMFLAWLFPKTSGLGLLRWQITSEADETIWWVAVMVIGLILFCWLSTTSFLLAQVISYVGGALLLLIFISHNSKPVKPTKT
ncbi:MAG: hypothetical protein WC621_01215 [Patescibacteria group bacterium]